MTKEELKNILDELTIKETEEYQRAIENAERNNQLTGLDSLGDIRKKYIQLRAVAFNEYSSSNQYQEGKS